MSRDDIYRERFAQNLQALCRGKTITKIALEMRVNHQTLRRYLSNEIEASLVNMCRIANYFGVSLDFLTGRDDGQNG